MKKLFFGLVTVAGFLVVGCSPASRTLQSNQVSGNQPGSGSLQAKLSWTSNLGEQQGFYVEESSDGTNFSQVLTVPDGTNTASVTVPSAGNYYFRIRGYNQAGSSPYSPVIKATM